ncbi:MAG: hypothetical protein PHS30_11130, partial [Bacteroidales bacterium]|nr:hypothetical protein [Bacteroidales bacterium]
MINEAIERRNLVIHNNGTINRKYLRNVDVSIIPENRKQIKEGEKLNISKGYFERVHDELLIAGIVLTHTCWRKWEKNKNEDADDNLIAIVEELAQKRKYMVLERIGTFCKRIKAYNDENKYIFEIKYCEGLKGLGRKNELQEEL